MRTRGVPEEQRAVQQGKIWRNQVEPELFNWERFGVKDCKPVTGAQIVREESENSLEDSLVEAHVYMSRAKST